MFGPTQLVWCRFKVFSKPQTVLKRFSWTLFPVKNWNSPSCGGAQPNIYQNRCKYLIYHFLKMKCVLEKKKKKALKTSAVQWHSMTVPDSLSPSRTHRYSQLVSVRVGLYAARMSTGEWTTVFTKWLCCPTRSLIKMASHYGPRVAVSSRLCLFCAFPERFLPFINIPLLRADFFVVVTTLHDHMKRKLGSSLGHEPGAPWWARPGWTSSRYDAVVKTWPVRRLMVWLIVSVHFLSLYSQTLIVDEVWSSPLTLDTRSLSMGLIWMFKHHKK